MSDNELKYTPLMIITQLKPTNLRRQPGVFYNDKSLQQRGYRFLLDKAVTIKLFLKLQFDSMLNHLIKDWLDNNGTLFDTEFEYEAPGLNLKYNEPKPMLTYDFENQSSVLT